ncbi:zinc transporter ZIP11 isoform X2 [Neodiprion pinetum]|uniref:Zinc transporter ZIP11 n=1 Tax=Neodiprion lecontei TaxID=441921 RepID=A0A6J0B7J5_NEOLC|nr:zinc transporter ZIP11 isoform X2 [Neodiprion lecontei]XP_046413264.1 zinc transporter ZIP11 isoform X2 [Neodiprion fabricii]XP_046466912.1 zinc transporter ZIP11 isoform X2 [Neodiprion pinetum]
MLRGYGPVTQALLGTLFTWGLTAAGAALVIFIRGKQRKLLDVSLGFAAGVMIAASYWSLLSPAITAASESKTYGENGEYAFLPVGLGFLIGAAFVYGTDVLISALGVQSPNVVLAMQSVGFYEQSTRRRQTVNTAPRVPEAGDVETVYEDPNDEAKNNQWRRILLLVVAITVHNIPEGLAVGVGFGAIGSTAEATFESARNLAIGIGIQNFPEGLAVSVPLQAAGFSTLKSFWYGQLSGMVEPIAGVLGAAGVSLASVALPYALSFAAGAMIYVVVDDIVPEAHSSGNGKLASWGAIVGFLIMMALDVGLG